LQEQQLTVKDIINDLLLQGDFETMGVVVACDSTEGSTLGDSTLLAQDGHRFALSYSILSLLQISVSYLLMQKFGAIASERHSQKVWGPSLNGLFTSIVDAVEHELQDVHSCLPALSAWCESEERFNRMKIILMKILRNSVTSVMLACIGGIATSSYLQVENATIFLPHARRLLCIYSKYSDAMKAQLDNKRFDLVECIQDWLLNEMRCIILFVSSTVGLCNKAATASNMGDDKFVLSKCYRPCVSSIVDSSALVASDSHPVWRRLGSHVKSWSQLGSNATTGLSHSDVHGSAEWREVLEIATIDFANVHEPDFGAKWFVDLVLSLPKLVVEATGSKDSELLCDVLGMDADTLGLTLMAELELEVGPKVLSAVMGSPIEMANVVIVEMEDLHGIDFASAFKQWMCRCKLATHAIVMMMNGEHRNCKAFMDLSATGSLDEVGDLKSVLCQNWFVCTVLLSTVVKRMQKMYASTSVDQLTSYMTQGMEKVNI
jgi:hypothetical protein